MTEKEYENFVDLLGKELEEFKEETLKKSKQEIFDRHYQITAFEEFNDYLFSEAINLDRDGFPKENVLYDIYDEFLSSDYGLSHDELYFFFENYTKDNKKYLHEETEGEM